VARAIDADPLLSFNFALIDLPTPGRLPLAFPGKRSKQTSFISFQGIDLPSITLETKTIKEGNWPRIHKVSLGFANAGTVTLRHAVLPTNTDMYYWFIQAMWGRVAPRRSLSLVHLRSDKIVQKRVLTLHDCIPESWQPSSALDGTTTEVVTEELVLQVSNITVDEPGDTGEGAGQAPGIARPAFGPAPSGTTPRSQRGGPSGRAEPFGRASSPARPFG